MGGWLVRPGLNRISRDGDTRHLEPRTMDLLVLLAHNARRVVSKDEIVASVWQGRIIADSSLTRVVADARRVLDDDASEPRFIETIPKRGYRLVAKLESLENRARRPRAAADRIVVLPFQSLGSPDRHDFALGISDEITTRIAAAGGLAVISRQSALQYADSSKSAGEIGDELAVQYILEGSVRWESGDREPYRVRISPQLIRVLDDSHVWAGSFDGILEDVIEMQIDIAREVLNQLDVALDPGERSQLLEPRTAVTEAYHAYLTGLAHQRRPDFWSTENLRIIALSWERAVTLDPSFAVAQAALSAIHSSSFAIGLDRSPERLAKAKEALDRALALDPHLPMAHFARGQYHVARREHDLAIEALETAALSLPNESEVHRSLGLILRSRGSWERSLEWSRRALELDPRDARIPASLGFTHMITRQYEEADRLYRRALNLQPDQSSAYVLKTLNDWLGFGDLARGRATLEAMPAADHPSALAVWWQQEIQERNYEAALERLDGSPLELLEDYLHLTPKSLLKAITLELLGRRGEAPAELRSARRLLERRLAEQPRDARALAALGEVLARLGDGEGALDAARKAVGLTPVEEDAVAGPIHLEVLARVELLTGDRQGALARLDHLLSIPSTISSRLLALDPRWDAVREDDRFRELIGRHSGR
jgi:serine/threonine-protein kinase